LFERPVTWRLFRVFIKALQQYCKGGPAESISVPNIGPVIPSHAVEAGRADARTLFGDTPILANVLLNETAANADGASDANDIWDLAVEE
jgi:hypothetical protein